MIRTILKFLFAATMWSLTTPVLAQTYEVMTLTGLGSDALAFSKKSGFISDSDTYFVDGKIRSRTVEKTTLDRTLENDTRFGANIELNQNLFLRPIVAAEIMRKVQESEETPRLIVTEEYSRIKPRLDLTFVTSNGLEVVAGATYWVVPAYERKSRTSSFETVAHVQDGTLLVPHLILVKRSSSFEGGCYYKVGSESNQEVVIYNSADSSELVYQQKLYDPTRVGMFFQGSAGDIGILGDFAAVEAGGGGDRTDNGDTIQEDYLSAKLAATLPLGSDFRSKFALTHKTLSYADNRNVTLPMMSMTGFHSHLILGGEESYTYLGVAYATGSERQSIPEFNNDYNVNIYGFSAGVLANF